MGEQPFKISEENKREAVEDKKRSRLAIAIALLISSFTALSGGKLIEEERESVRTAESKLVETDIELPITKADLQRIILGQAGVRTTQELAINPEAIKKIDLGLYFLQTEFLENKITSREALRAWKILQFKRKVFQKLAQEIPDKAAVYQAILNEIVDPEIFLEPVPIAKKNAENDYASGEALLSKALLQGKSNCYGSSRLFISLASSVFPKETFKLHVPPEHVRTVVTMNGEDWAAEPGVIFQPVQKEELSGTVMYADAARAYLHEYGVHSPVVSYKSDGRDNGGSYKNISTAVRRALSYNTTAGADFFQGGLNEIPSLTMPTDIPDTANRERVSANAVTNWGWRTSDVAALETQRNKKPETDNTGEQIKDIIAHAAEAAREPEFKLVQNKAEAGATQEKPGTNAANPEIKEVKLKNRFEEAKQKEADALLYGAQYNLPRLLRSIAADPARRADYERVINETLAALKQRGAFEKFKADNESYVQQVLGDTHSEYAESYRTLATYIKRWEGNAKIAEQELQKNAVKVLLADFYAEGRLDFEASVVKLTQLSKPELHPYIQSYYFLDLEGAKQLLRAVNQRPDELVGKEIAHRATMLIGNNNYFKDKEFEQLFDEMISKINLTQISITGAPQGNMPLMKKIIDSGKQPQVQWIAPFAGDIKPMESLVLADKVDLLIVGGDQQIPAYIDKETMTIVEPQTIEEAKALGPKYRADVVCRDIITRKLFNNEGAVDIGFGQFASLSDAEIQQLIARLNKRGISHVGLKSVSNTESLEMFGHENDFFVVDKIENFTIENKFVPLDKIFQTMPALKKLVIKGEHVNFSIAQPLFLIKDKINDKLSIVFDHVGNIQELNLNYLGSVAVIKDDFNNIIPLIKKVGNQIETIEVLETKGNLKFRIVYATQSSVVGFVGEIYEIADYHSLSALRLLLAKGVKPKQISFAKSHAEDLSDILNVRGYFNYFVDAHIQIINGGDIFLTKETGTLEYSETHRLERPGH